MEIQEIEITTKNRQEIIDLYSDKEKLLEHRIKNNFGFDYISEIDFSYADLRYADFDNVIFNHCIFYNTNIEGACFDFSLFKHTRGIYVINADYETQFYAVAHTDKLMLFVESYLFWGSLSDFEKEYGDHFKPQIAYLKIIESKIKEQIWP